MADRDRPARARAARRGRRSRAGTRPRGYAVARPQLARAARASSTWSSRAATVRRVLRGEDPRVRPRSARRPRRSPSPKQRRLRTLALRWLAGAPGRRVRATLRFDVASVLARRGEAGGRGAGVGLLAIVGVSRALYRGYGASPPGTQRRGGYRGGRRGQRLWRGGPPPYAGKTQQEVATMNLPFRYVPAGLLLASAILLSQARLPRIEAAGVMAPRFEVDPFWPNRCPTTGCSGRPSGSRPTRRDTSGSCIVPVRWNPARYTPRPTRRSRNVARRPRQCWSSMRRGISWAIGADPDRASTGRIPTTGSRWIIRATSGSAAMAEGSAAGSGFAIARQFHSEIYPYRAVPFPDRPARARAKAATTWRIFGCRQKSS